MKQNTEFCQFDGEPKSPLCDGIDCAVCASSGLCPAGCGLPRFQCGMYNCNECQIYIDSQSVEQIPSDQLVLEYA